MADALCGPSNALQDFQKHTTLDRTLQQDRLNHRGLPVESFRSNTGLQNGQLDAELQHFHATNALQTGYPEPPAAWQANFPPQQQIHSSHQLDCASDFQALQLRDNSRAAGGPLQQQHQHQPGFNAASYQHFAQPSPSHQNLLQSQSSNSKAAFYQQQPPFSKYRPSPFLQSFNHDTQRHSSPQQQQVDNDAAFADAFTSIAQAEANLSLQQQQSQQTHSTLDATTAKGKQPASALQDEPSYRIGSDRILDEALSQSQHTADEADDLAHTAATLLETVKDDDSDKFQQSNFLALMRQLRDREVKVQGDKIVDSMHAEQALHPGGSAYPHSDSYEHEAGDAERRLSY